MSLPAPSDNENVAARRDADRLRVERYENFESLPTRYDKLLAEAGQSSFCLTRWWFETLAQQIVEPDERLLLLGVETARAPSAAAALLIGRERIRKGFPWRPRRLFGLSNFYSMVFEPLIAADAESAPCLAAIAKGLAERSYDVCRLTGLDPRSAVFPGLKGALASNGYLVQAHFHMANWYEPVSADTAAGYLSRRPGRLRNTLRRKAKALKARGAETRVFRDTAELERGIADYERTYAESWQKHEPYPGVIRALLRHCAALGGLRLGVLYLDGEPIAAQIWITWAGKATLYKLAFDRRFGKLSPGTVLTMRMIEMLIDSDRPAELDFGIGDDAYKSQWASHRRERWGLAAFNARRPYGILGALRHLGGRWVKNSLLAGPR